ncbi:hypothetical protein T11_64 [Trichinella zimbabwensis]|uniref:Uncharacterized protein n=1 Tax=Trichinella zimbabwensis TaxID=268475 RepID=A0A0V1H2E9_9BILA|nr:hypothetical protein T11_64 [Trichinella zimbabwensis]
MIDRQSAFKYSTTTITINHYWNLILLSETMSAKVVQKCQTVGTGVALTSGCVLHFHACATGAIFFHKDTPHTDNAVTAFLPI